MGVTVAILVATAIAVAVMVTVAATGRRRRGGLSALGLPADSPGLVNPADPPVHPAGPAFIIQGNPDPGFIVVARSGGQRAPDPINAGGGQPGRTAPRGFELVGITQNMTAICKLTGSPAGECACERHRGHRRKEKR